MGRGTKRVHRPEKSCVDPRRRPDPAAGTTAGDGDGLPRRHDAKRDCRNLEPAPGHHQGAHPARGAQVARRPQRSLMIDEPSEAEASLYVLGALPAEELREFERAMRADLQLQLLVNELRAAAAALVVALPRRDPPPSLKQRLLETIDRQEGPAGDAAGGSQLEPPAW